jgi:hypothetical protein
MTLRMFLPWAVVLATAANLFGRSGTSQVAWPGRPVAARADWPSNALELINDPARTEGWNPWFSEWPNDVEHFTFKLRDTDDANRLLRRLAKIPGKVELKLNPGREPGALGFTTGLKPGNGHAALFSLGKQKRIDEWFARLPQDEHGVRIFGKQRHTNAPAALPPTLTLYINSGSIELEKLEIPARVNVTADISETARKADTNDSVIKSIDEFVARRRALR